MVNLCEGSASSKHHSQKMKICFAPCCLDEKVRIHRMVDLSIPYTRIIRDLRHSTFHGAKDTVQDPTVRT
jgi:hypothetical protein